ncbi:2-dehydropantoate 2-reductase OS=Castellaniella defragrans OX=75697 GN=HNR28_003416 PE=3 SV=1 [Castellaniella defragrans]
MSKISRTLVIGSGPIGSYFAAQLTRCGIDVTLHGKGVGFQRTARQGGIRVVPRADPGQAWFASLKCAIEPPPPGGWDLVIFAVKAQELGSAASQFALHAKGAVTLLPQNGLPWWQFLGTEAAPIRLGSVDPEALAERSLPLERIAGCVVTKGLTLTIDGELLEAQVQSDSFVVGDIVQGAGVALQVVDLLRAAGLPAKVSSDIRADKWRKLLINVAFNPLGALSQLGFGEVLDDTKGAELARRLMEEAVTVAHSCGFHFPVDVDAAFERARSNRAHKTSMLQDVQLGRPLELDPIVGVLLELAHRQGQLVPALSTIYACLRLLDLSLRKGPITQQIRNSRTN